MTNDNGQLVRAADQLADHVTHWSAPRWAQPSASGAGTRADVVYALVQRLAELAAAAEGEPVRPVPRLPNDLALVDQVRVMLLDLMAAPSDAAIRQAAVDAITEARSRL